MHFLPGFKHSYLSNSFFLEKGSLGLGLDAPKLEISQVVPGSPENELCAAMTFCFAMTSYPDALSHITFTLKHCRDLLYKRALSSPPVMVIP